ncbi:suppressor of fused domain protein [Epibacterium sp. SM1969]|uniref:Suppressor of fused domain protein n=1 Tax=Tritonibacter aquimaris TaxID=2663379 RepID=A0A844AJI2_9RHOB|nr:suppressor of fused domain protein [Tritonibacter aquimaris]MQY41115.1 suppressor of fused domain protein [Tritonibacter aquimaris]
MMMDLETVWEYREETAYPELLGSKSRGIFPLSQASFQPFGDARIDARWLQYGVFEFAPTDRRASWVYITSGQSNPWDVPPEEYQPDGASGAGVEFSIETQAQGDWAIRFLLKMLAYDLLLSHGHFGDRPPLGLDDRIPLGGPIDGKEGTPITNVILHSPVSYAPQFQLPSGTVEILQFIGVTEQERDLARNEGFASLRTRLESDGSFPATRLVR